eukprot:3708365-Amphidinium_carterae.1
MVNAKCASSGDAKLSQQGCDGYQLAAGTAKAVHAVCNMHTHSQGASKMHPSSDRMRNECTMGWAIKVE